MGRPVSSRSWDKKRYAEDPEYRQRRLAEHRAYRAKYRAELAARHRRKVQADPDYRDKRRARSYGLSFREFKAIFARQGNVCAICKTSSRRLCIDHCHATGKVRGFLCNKCNVGLGYYNDDPRLMRAATAYLEAARESE
jgi:Recombination endonuclease VII